MPLSRTRCQERQSFKETINQDANYLPPSQNAQRGKSPKPIRERERVPVFGPLTVERPDERGREGGEEDGGEDEDGESDGLGLRTLGHVPVLVHVPLGIGVEAMAAVT